MCVVVVKFHPAGFSFRGGSQKPCPQWHQSASTSNYAEATADNELPEVNTHRCWCNSLCHVTRVFSSITSPLKCATVQHQLLPTLASVWTLARLVWACTTPSSSPAYQKFRVCWCLCCVWADDHSAPWLCSWVALPAFCPYCFPDATVSDHVTKECLVPTGTFWFWLAAGTGDPVLVISLALLGKLCILVVILITTLYSIELFPTTVRYSTSTTSPTASPQCSQKWLYKYFKTVTWIANGIHITFQWEAHKYVTTS